MSTYLLETDLRSELALTGQWVGQKGWCPATSGNLSGRIDEGSYLISVSGKNKGSLSPDDFMPVNLEGKPLGDARKPSAETLLHGVIYRLHPEARFVVHTHSVFATVMTRQAGEGVIVFQDYELLKAFSGIETHDISRELAVFANSQDMVALATRVEAGIASPDVPAFGLAGHGVYSWGRTPAEARRHAEAIEVLMECEYRARLLNR